MVLLTVTDDSCDLYKVLTYAMALASSTGGIEGFIYRNEQRRGSQAETLLLMGVVVKCEPGLDGV